MDDSSCNKEGGGSIASVMTFANSISEGTTEIASACIHVTKLFDFVYIT